MIRLLTSLVAVLTVTSIQSQTTLRETPKLVIGITIDQLRGDYLELFQHTFGEKGFKRLLNEGLVYQDLKYDFPNLNEASSTATIYTGTNPFYHGITGNQVYIPSQKRQKPIFDDNAFLGNYTQEKLSPKALKVGTIADELKLASKGSSDIFSLSPNPSEALISAGHLANGAYWINDISGKWSTSTYYENIYWTLEQENKTGKYANSISALVWQPLLNLDEYNNIPYAGENKPFSHQFSKLTNPYLGFKKSPYINESITQTAIELMQKDNMGKRQSPDFLALTYYAGDYITSRGDYSLETQDLYTRLDRDLSKLIEEVDKNVGLQNTLIFIISTGYYDSNTQYPKEKQAQLGTFYPTRCKALLNMYLMAIYGKGQWVEGYDNLQIYLNRKLIEEKNIDLFEIQRKAAEFVIQFTGVQDVAISTQLLAGTVGNDMQEYRNMVLRGYSGDIFIKVQVGYQIENENTNKQSIQQPIKIQRETAIACPAIFFGYNIKPERIKRTINATEIAPTICRILRIRSPNSCHAEALPEFL